jgi:hypothetical protein
MHRNGIVRRQVLIAAVMPCREYLNWLQKATALFALRQLNRFAYIEGKPRRAVIPVFLSIDKIRVMFLLIFWGG